MSAARSRGRRGTRLAATLLLLAVSPASAEEPPPESVLADLAFLDFPEPNRIIVDLAPDGSAKPLRLMLDTGAGHSMLTPRTARELGVQVRRTKQDPYRRPTRLGRDLQFYVDASVSDTGAKTGWEFGVLGGNFLADYVLEIDFPARRVRLLDPDRCSVPAAGGAAEEAVVPLRVVGQRPGVEIRLLLLSEGDRFLAYLVRPESAGARRGLRSGDWIEGMASAEAIARTLREGEQLSVIRMVDGVGVATVLEPTAPPSAVSAPPQNP